MQQNTQSAAVSGAPIPPTDGGNARFVNFKGIAVGSPEGSLAVNGVAAAWSGEKQPLVVYCH